MKCFCLNIWMTSRKPGKTPPITWQKPIKAGVSVAKKNVGHGMSLLDLIQEGNIALNKGRGRSLIRIRVSNSALMRPGGYASQLPVLIADQARTIRVPVHMIEKQLINY